MGASVCQMLRTLCSKFTLSWALLPRSLAPISSSRNPGATTHRDSHTLADMATVVPVMVQVQPSSPAQTGSAPHFARSARCVLRAGASRAPRAVGGRHRGGLRICSGASPLCARAPAVRAGERSPS